MKIRIWINLHVEIVYNMKINGPEMLTILAPKVNINFSSHLPHEYYKIVW